MFESLSIGGIVRWLIYEYFATLYKLYGPFNFEHSKQSDKPDTGALLQETQCRSDPFADDARAQSDWHISKILCHPACIVAPWVDRRNMDKVDRLSAVESSVAVACTDETVMDCMALRRDQD